MQHVRSQDGTRVAYEQIGEGPPLVLVHGTLDDHRYWRPVLDEIAARYRVYVVDRRGRGGSGPQHVDSYTIEREFEDIAAVANAIDAPVHLLGHSSGARYALHAALGIDRLRTLTLYEPPPFAAPPPEILDSLAKLMEAGDRDGIVQAFWSEVVGVPAEEIEELRRSPAWQMSRDNAHTLLPELRSFGAYRFEPAEMARLRIPVLLLKGTDSPPFLQEQVDELATLLPDSRVVVLEGQGHEAVHTAPDLFTRNVVRFLAAN